MKRLLGSALLIIGSIVLSVVMAELATRMIDGHPLFAVDLRPVGGTEGSDTTANHLDKLPRAEGATRELFMSNPPPLPNRTKPPEDWVKLHQQIENGTARGGAPTGKPPFHDWDMFKAWNSAFVGDVCKHGYLKGAPGQLFVYDPPDGRDHPVFRYLPNTTTPMGLVTNGFGWRGPPVQFARSPKTIRIVFVGASTTAEAHGYPFSGPEYVDNWLNRWAAARGLDVRFEVLNAGREALISTDIAAVVRQEVAPLRPDLVVYYEGGNQLDLSTVVKDVPKGVPQPAGTVARWLRDLSKHSALARRLEAITDRGEWPKPAYEVSWPEGLDEFKPDITRTDLPVNLSTILRDLDSIRGELSAVGGELAVASFHWLAKDGLQLDGNRHKPLVEGLNVSLFPFRYRDLERMTNFENRVFEKYAATNDIPFIDVARYMPFDPELYADAFHSTPAGVKLRAWIVFLQLVPLIEKKLASGEWPKPVPIMANIHPAFAASPRRITFDCSKAP
jgi:hypothetical protein